MRGFDTFKKGFDRWEIRTADRLETVLKSPLLLRPAGTLLTAAMKAKAVSDRAASVLWASFGLSTRRDQERTLHALNQIESRLLDLEEKLSEKK